MFGTHISRPLHIIKKMIFFGNLSMTYPYDYAVIGGDMRQIYLVREFVLHSNHVCHYALSEAPDAQGCTDAAFVTAAASLEELCQASSCIIGPVPLCRNESFLNQAAFEEPIFTDQLLNSLSPGQSFFAGSIPEAFKCTASEKGIRIYDLLLDPSLTVYNTVATAEGAVCEAIRRSPLNLHHSRCAVLGYGRCGRTLTYYLKGMFCHVSVISNTEEKRAQAALIADQTADLTGFGRYASEFDFIFNTIPQQVVTRELMAGMKPSVTIIDIASAPGGVDLNAASDLGIRAALCLGLPGTYAPASSAKALREAIERIVQARELSHEQ